MLLPLLDLGVMCVSVVFYLSGGRNKRQASHRNRRFEVVITDAVLVTNAGLDIQPKPEFIIAIDGCWLFTTHQRPPIVTTLSISRTGGLVQYVDQAP